MGLEVMGWVANVISGGGGGIQSPLHWETSTSTGNASRTLFMFPDVVATIYGATDGDAPIDPAHISVSGGGMQLDYAPAFGNVVTALFSSGAAGLQKPLAWETSGTAGDGATTLFPFPTTIVAIYWATDGDAPIDPSHVTVSGGSMQLDYAPAVGNVITCLHS